VRCLWRVQSRVHQRWAQHLQDLPYGPRLAVVVGQAPVRRRRAGRVFGGRSVSTTTRSGGAAADPPAAGALRAGRLGLDSGRVGGGRGVRRVVVVGESGAGRQGRRGPRPGPAGVRMLAADETGVRSVRWLLEEAGWRAKHTLRDASSERPTISTGRTRDSLHERQVVKHRAASKPAAASSSRRS
jgi:hypothetical protein